MRFGESRASGGIAGEELTRDSVRSLARAASKRAFCSLVSAA